MADRRVTVLNPGGYQEVLQTADRLLVESPSSFAAADFSSSITGTTAAFTGNVTIGGTPSSNTDAATVQFVNDVVAGVTLTASSPISIVSQDIQIAGATDSAVGAVRFATNTEVINGTAVDAAVKPNQLAYVLDDLVIDGNAPVTVTESTPNNFDIAINDATTSFKGAVRFATTAEASGGTNTSTETTPKNVADSIAAIPNPTASVRGLARFATGAEITAGTANDVAVTPAQLSSSVGAVDVTGTSPITVAQTGTTFDVDINYATENAAGAMRFANNSEFTGGTATNVAITPLQLETRFGGVTIGDASTSTKGLIEIATNAEVTAGTATDLAVTPASLRYALDQPGYVLDAGTY